MGKLIVLNHKMNLEYDDVFSYINRLNQIDTDHNLIVCPSSIYLTDFVNHCHWGVGSQNVSLYDAGNYTGEVSCLQLKSIGIEYSMIGHYERKKYFHETDEDIHQKLITCLESNIVPILCFGETGKKEDILSSLEILLKDIERIDFIIFAYEPMQVKNKQSIDDIEEQVKLIYNYLYDRYQTRPNIVYGGGIYQKDVQAILNICQLNGLLIGGVSADIGKMEKILS